MISVRERPLMADRWTEKLIDGEQEARDCREAPALGQSANHCPDSDYPNHTLDVVGKNGKAHFRADVG